jgi:uncharacterized protein (TIGR02145 family)
VGYYYGIPDTCEFTVYVVMACPKTVDDIELNTYTVTPLLGLCWTSNIASTLYSDEISIAFANPYYSMIYPNTVANKNLFGLLYTWFSAVRLPEGRAGNSTGFVQGICPEGWHVPLKSEWNLLEIYEVQMLRSEHHWIAPGTNETDFTSLPAGMYKATMGRYVDLYAATGYWASEESINKANAHYFMMNYYCNSTQILDIPKIDALSVRCVMDY